MKYLLEWEGCRVAENEWFKASVPGNIQVDYGNYKNFPDIHMGKNVEIYEQFEDDEWMYRTYFDIKPQKNERLYFVSHGIEYEYEISINGETIFSHEGMFTKAEIDLTDYLKDKNCLSVRIFPHPLSGEKRGTGRDEAKKSVKPAVGYGWDWHPRCVSSGMWEAAYLETRDENKIRECFPTYKLNEERTKAVVNFDINCDIIPEICLYDPHNNVVYKGFDTSFEVDNIKLWWCNGQGEPNRYYYTVKTPGDEVSGYIGFKTVKLEMNEGKWYEPFDFPKSRSVAPITIELNGRKIFAKGSNWVRPEMFPGICDKNTYAPLIQYAKDANMNIFRCWGGSEIFKESFYDLCDEMGIMIWQEFPLACNNYPDDNHYLEILQQEAEAIIKRLRSHACLVLWCGGNELFNSWSGMTEQSLPLRLLGKLCYELDRNRPFIMTSPIIGMAHGGYTFVDYNTHKDVFYTFSHSSNTAYTEFGVPGVSSPEYLKTFIPEDELFPLKEGTSWEKHHAFKAWIKDTWLCSEVIQRYFGEITDLESLYYNTNWMQCEGYKAIFEEARRQWPKCSMAINWCYNEPWKVAAGNSLINYPANPKPCYEAVKSSLRNTMASARIPKFDWKEGELFSAELWLLNDEPKAVVSDITAYLMIGDEKIKLIKWENVSAEPNLNKQGHTVQYILPPCDENFFVLRLESDFGISEYKLKYEPNIERIKSRTLNL